MSQVYLTILCGVPKVASGLVKGGIIRTVKSKGGPRFSIVPSGGTKGTHRLLSFIVGHYPCLLCTSLHRGLC